ncbi:hypothetical protein CIB84_009908 [Bambusicola thoracicus]|uniref:Uncharacterized protein n=1 Tax=Bambusicola thoracicus TaxID=9083 RepID=A0A2P4SQF8_BAMTH|nr:hypothetical protein CIB84_009908 [Bambusicola thoracicus]
MDKNSEGEDGSDFDETCDLDRVWADSTQWLALYMVDKYRVVEELVDNLVWACRGLSCHTFSPRLQRATGEEMREEQEPSLLHTLYKGSYLHIEKTAHWFQNQVKAAWRHLPLSCDCHLTVLLSYRSGKIKVTTASMHTFSIEMIPGVQLDDSHTFLSFE